jgi:hypothetical protein
VSIHFHDNTLVPADSPTLVTPRPGMANVRAHAFAGVTAGSRGVRVLFWGGVAPCFVLDRVEVHETPDAVTITLWAGSDPASPDAACIEIALHLAVDVELRAPFRGRPILDGAASGARRPLLDGP